MSETVERDPRRDWTEDAAHENGNYQCRCVNCAQGFTGHKRRVVCKICASAPHLRVTEVERDPRMAGVRVYCGHCKRWKVPHGRNVPGTIYGTVCMDDCPGYHQEPLSGCLWPEETSVGFGFRHCKAATAEVIQKGDGHGDS